MITLFSVAIAWYLTKLYYTKSFTIKSYEVEAGLVRATCVKCSRVSIITQKNMRTPFYCIICH